MFPIAKKFSFCSALLAESSLLVRNRAANPKKIPSGPASNLCFYNRHQRAYLQGAPGRRASKVGWPAQCSGRAFEIDYRPRVERVALRPGPVRSLRVPGGMSFTAHPPQHALKHQTTQERCRSSISNFIEGMRFAVAEAAAIVFENRIPNAAMLIRKSDWPDE